MKGSAGGAPAAGATEVGVGKDGFVGGFACERRGVKGGSAALRQPPASSARSSKTPSTLSPPPIVVVGDDGENIVGLIFACRLIGVAFPNINGTVWFPRWMVLSNISCCCCCMVSFMTAMSLTSNDI